MHAEAKSEHFIVYPRRPIFAYIVAVTILADYFVLPFLQRLGMQPVIVPGDVWNVCLAVLGISALTRGVEKNDNESHLPHTTNYLLRDE